jgi:hypothetical protein
MPNWSWKISPMSLPTAMNKLKTSSEIELPRVQKLETLPDRGSGDATLLKVIDRETSPFAKTPNLTIIDRVAEPPDESVISCHE